MSPDFIATPTQGKAPLVVLFYDQSAGSPTSWYWNFGDGHTSTLQNPAHQFDSVGVYDVTLTISSANGTKSITKFGFIDVLVDGIYSVDNQYSLNVYPNPKNYLQIQKPKSGPIEFDPFNTTFSTRFLRVAARFQQRCFRNASHIHVLLLPACAIPPALLHS